MRLTRLFIFVSSSLPRVDGEMAKVYEMPSWLWWNGSLATDERAATAPLTSRPFIGFAPGANGTPFGRPSGVAPVFLPYTTLEVMVRSDCVGMAWRYVSCWRRYSMNFSVTMRASLSVFSSLLPNGSVGLPSCSKPTAMPLSSRMMRTLPYLTAASESVTMDRPAIPVARVRITSPSMRAIW